MEYQLLKLVFADVSSHAAADGKLDCTVEDIIGGPLKQATLRSYRQRFHVRKPRVYGGWTTCVRVETADGYDLVAKVPLDDRRPHGVFSSRSPRRPNPIGLSVVELLGRDGPRLRVRGVDMLDGTPILDIKPYLTSIPSEKLRRGWVGEAEARKRGA